MTRVTPLRAMFAILLLAATTVVALRRAEPIFGATAPGQDPVLVAAGDIAESGSSTMANARSTGDLVREIAPTYALALGDNAYNDGSDADYRDKYDPTWGSFKSITKPVPGNHEWHTDGQGYYNYFFGGATIPWYAYDIDNGWRA